MTVQPLPGDFGLTQIGGYAGRLIRFGQWLNGDGFANFEHAFVYIGGGQIVEAEPGGARIRPVTEYAAANVCWSTGRFDLTPAERTAIASTAKMYADLKTPYSFLDYVALAGDRLHLPHRLLQNYVASTGHMICSQLVAAAYYKAGAPLYSTWTGYVTPEDLYNLIDRSCASLPALQ